MKSSKNSSSQQENSLDQSTQADGLTTEDLAKLKSKFPKDRLGVKVQSYSRDKTKAMLVLYLQHTDVQNRLEEVDPSWTTHIVQEHLSGQTWYVRMKMELKGIARENVGEGQDPKAAYSDALKRCAMLFGVGRYLYDAPIVWVDYDENRDRFRQWGIEDYEKFMNRRKPSENTASATAGEEAPAAPYAGAGQVRPVSNTGARPTARGAPSSR